MGKNRKWIQISILAVILVIGVFTIYSNLSSGKEKKALTAGDEAPNFKLAGLDGRTYELVDFKGKALMINFWGTFCEPCKEEMPAIMHQYQQWSEKGVEVLAVNLGESEVTIQNFISNSKAHSEKTYGKPFTKDLPILLDTTDQVRKLYQVTQYPTTFFIDSKGNIREIKIGGMDDAYIHDKLTQLTTK